MNERIVDDERIVIGKVLRPRGIKGEVIVRILTDFPDRLLDMDELCLRWDDGGQRLMSVRQLKVRDAATAHVLLAGIDSRNDAETLKGAVVVVEKDDTVDLDDDSFYIYDLIGLSARDEDGALLGRIRDIESYPANDVVILETETSEVMVPAVKEYFKKIEPDGDGVVLSLSEGLPVRKKRR